MKTGQPWINNATCYFLRHQSGRAKLNGCGDYLLFSSYGEAFRMRESLRAMGEFYQIIEVNPLEK